MDMTLETKCIIETNLLKLFYIHLKLYQELIINSWLYVLLPMYVVIIPL